MMTPVQRRLYDLLPHPAANRGPTVRELAERVGTSHTSTFYTLGRLVRDGWAEEARCSCCDATHGYRRRERN